MNEYSPCATCQSRNPSLRYGNDPAAASEAYVGMLTWRARNDMDAARQRIVDAWDDDIHKARPLLHDLLPTSLSKSNLHSLDTCQEFRVISSVALSRNTRIAIEKVMTIRPLSLPSFRCPPCPTETWCFATFRCN